MITFMKKVVLYSLFLVVNYYTFFVLGIFEYSFKVSVCCGEFSFILVYETNRASI